jgi:hypothetical protein
MPGDPVGVASNGDRPGIFFISRQRWANIGMA